MPAFAHTLCLFRLVDTLGVEGVHVDSMADVYFYGNASPFSNFYPVINGFTYDGVHLPTSEHHLMYQKALLMGDAATAGKIREATKPLEAKRLGRKVAPFDQQKWAANCEDLMTNILIAKFKHPGMRDHLVDTGFANIYEASHRDKIWGIGISVKAAEAGAAHNGRNLLGKCLMRARETVAA